MFSALKWKRQSPEMVFTTGFGIELGEGIEKAAKTAFSWYEKAAEQGHEDAIRLLESV